MKLITEKQSGAAMQGYRTGAKQQDINQIRAMTEQGQSVDQISKQLLIVPECVQSFVDKFQGRGQAPASDKPVKRRRRSRAQALARNPVESSETADTENPC